MTAAGRYLAKSALIAVALLPTACRQHNIENGPVSKEKLQASADSVSFKETFTYKTIGNTDIKADVYRLAGQDLRPVIIWLHPGALIFGNREMLPADERERFLRAGYVVVAVDYRLAPETKLPEILKDIEDAHQWVRNKGPTLFRIDPQRVVDVGQSAGGYLALLAGVHVQPRVKAVVSFYGYGDITGEWLSRPDAFYLNQRRVTKEDAYRLIGRQVLSGSPPGPRIDFYVYCRQNGIWPQEVAGFDPGTEPEKFDPYFPERLVNSGYPPGTAAPRRSGHGCALPDVRADGSGV